MKNSPQPFKALLLAGLLAGPWLAFNAMAVPETDYHWSPLDVITDPSGTNYAYFDDSQNWDSGFVPTVTNSAGAYIRPMVNQATGNHITCVITSNVDMYQLMVGTGTGGGGDVIITNGAQVTAGLGLDGGPTQWSGLAFPGGPSTLYIGPGCSLTCGDHLWIGNGQADSVGTLTIDGGTLHIPWAVWLGLEWVRWHHQLYHPHQRRPFFLNQWASPTLGQGGCIGILDIADNASKL